MNRTLIFVPGNSARFINSAKKINADIVCFDLEDSVPYHEKSSAREMIGEAVSQTDDFKNTFSLYVRTNSYDSGQTVHRPYGSSTERNYRCRHTKGQRGYRNLRNIIVYI